MNIVDSVAALIVAVLSGTGVGGGGLFIIYLTALGNYGQLSAQRLNLIFFVFASLAAIPYHLSKRKINSGTVIISIITGICGTLAGTVLRRSFSTETVRTVFGIMLIIMGLYTLLGSLRKSIGKQYPKGGNNPSRRHKEK